MRAALICAVILSSVSQAQRATFAPSGTFAGKGTKTGVFTQRDLRTGAFNKERAIPSAVELVYTPGAATRACDTIATIQVVWYWDPVAKRVRMQSEVSPALDRAADLDKASAGGYVIDFNDEESTPYYQDSGAGVLNGGETGRSDGKGNGTPAHTSDAPSSLSKEGWQKQFETWAVCTAGIGAGDVLAGLTWMVDPAGKASITQQDLPSASQHFRDALKSWKQWYNANPQHPRYNEPGKGFSF